MAEALGMRCVVDWGRVEALGNGGTFARAMAEALEEALEPFLTLADLRPGKGLLSVDARTLGRAT